MGQAKLVGDYLTTVLTVEGIDKAVKKIVAALIPHDSEFDGIAFRGMSGALIAPFVAKVMKKKILMVRKPGENSHSMYRAEGDFSTKNYMIVDDLVSSGLTVKAIVDSITYEYNKRTQEVAPKCVGFVAYKEQQRWYNKGQSKHENLAEHIKNDFFAYGVADDEY